jgi:hypothetical protein
MSTTQIPFSAAVESISDAVAAMLNEATQITRASTQAYLTGLEAVVEQQKLARDNSRRWMSEVATAQTDLGRQIIGSYTTDTVRLATAAANSAEVSESAATDALQTTQPAVSES